MSNDAPRSFPALVPRADRLPWTVLVQIFRHATRTNDPSAPYPYFSIAQVVRLSLVCKHWRAVATGTPILWAFVYLLPTAVYRLLRNPEQQSALKALDTIFRRSTTFTVYIQVALIPKHEDMSLTENQRHQRRSLALWLILRVILQHIEHALCIHISVDHPLLVTRVLTEIAKKKNSPSPLRMFQLTLDDADPKVLSLGPMLNEKGERPILALPGRELLNLTLQNVAFDWDASMFGPTDSRVPFPKVRLLTMHYPPPYQDPQRIWKVPSFDRFATMLISLPNLVALDLTVFGPNEHTFPKLGANSYLWLDNLRSLKLRAMRPTYMTRLLQYFNLSRLTELMLYLEPSVTEPFVPMGLGEDEHEWAPLISVLRGAHTMERPWLSLKALTTLKLHSADVPWGRLAAVFENTSSVRDLTIPITEVPALAAYTDEAKTTCVLPALSVLALCSENGDPAIQLARIVRKALLQRTRRMPPLKELSGPSWLIDWLCDLGRYDLYAVDMHSWPECDEI